MRNNTERNRGAAFTALFTLLVAAYLVTGSGRFHIVDEVSLFAVTESVAKRGALDTNAIAWTQWVNSPGEVLGAFGPEGDVFSKKGPAPAFLAVPFYLIGWLSAIPGSGVLAMSMLQTTLWFNAVVTALTALLLARAVLALGYRLRTALVAGCLYGLGTIAWPYATHFFGEPVSTLAILGMFYALLRLRQTDAWRYAAGAGLAAGVMVATSAAHAVLLLPFGLYLLYAGWAGSHASPPSSQRAGLFGAKRLAKLIGPLTVFVIPLAYVAALLVWYNWARYGTPFSTGYHFEAGEGFTANWAQGLWGLLFSPYRGFFWYTPVAIASVVAWPRFIRHHRAEGLLLAAVALILVGLFGKWWMWWAGFAWGPRFLVPLAPLVVLALAPWLDLPPQPPSLRDLTPQPPSLRGKGEVPLPSQGRGWGRGFIYLALLAGISVVVQLLAVSVNYVNYEIALREFYPTDWADPLKYGPPALFDPVHSPVLGQVRLLLANLRANLDLGWVLDGRIVWEVPLVGLAVVLSASVTWWLARQDKQCLARLAAVLSVGALLLLVAVSALAYGEQPEYGVPDQGYIAALAEIDRRGGPADGIVTIAPYSYQMPMARYRGRLPIYGYAAEPMPLHRETEAVLWRALRRHPLLWLVTKGLPPADPANGVEAWLSQHAFKAEEWWFDDARLVVFVTTDRLEPAAVNGRLGEAVRLVGVRTSGETARPGGTLAVELTWQADASLSTSLHGFLQLLTPDGRLAVGQDGVPGGGYTPSRGWTPGAVITDRRGLLLPAMLPPGEYSLIAGLYDAATGQRLPVVAPDGNVQGDFVRLGAVRVE